MILKVVPDDMEQERGAFKVDVAPREAMVGPKCPDSLNLVNKIKYIVKNPRRPA